MANSDDCIKVTVIFGLDDNASSPVLAELIEYAEEEELDIGIVTNDIASKGSTSSDNSNTSGGDNDAASSSSPFPSVNISTGCLCCGESRDELLAAIRSLVLEHHCDYLLIVAAATVEPINLAEALEEIDRDFLVCLDTIVAVVNENTIKANICNFDLLSAEQGEPDATKLSKAHLYLDQLQAANTIVYEEQQPDVLLLDNPTNDSLTKSNKDVDEYEVGLFTELLTLLNPKADPVVCQDGLNIDTVDPLLDTGAFDFDILATAVDRQIQTVRQGKVTSIDYPEISRLYYHRRRPFHPARLHEFILRHFVLQDVWQQNTQHQQKTLDTLAQCWKENKIVVQSGGYVWLSTRPDVYGEWRQAGGVLRISDGGAWLAALPKEARPTGGDDLKEFTKDFDGPYGDRRQELYFWGVNTDFNALEKELDACLVTDKELENYLETAEVVEGEQHQENSSSRADVDPFGPWPTLQERMGNVNDNDSDGTLSDIQEEDEEEEEQDAVQEEPGKNPGGARQGTVINITEGAAELQTILDQLEPNAVAIVDWHAHWCPPCQDLDNGPLQKLALQYPGAAILRLDVLGGGSANRLVANEKVLSKPNAARQGAKPVLKSGGRFPCFTLHLPHSLQFVEQFDGDDALEKVEAALRARALPPLAFIDGSLLAFEKLSLDDDTDSARQQKFQQAEILANGAGQFKEILVTARREGHIVVVIWIDSSSTQDNGNGGQSQLESTNKALLAAAQHAVSETASDGIQIVSCDVSSSPANQVLAKGLKILATPEIHAYKDMKLCEGGRIFQKQATIESLNNLIARLVPLSLQSVAAVHSARLAEAEAAQDESTTPDSSNEFDPPQAKFAKAGMTKIMADGSTEGHFFPKMPCLRCGCPWWSSDGWNAVCLRCGWDCERDGYDDDSVPLPAFKAKWERFTAAIKSGVTPEWQGKRLVR